jgi:hypothetical protein
VIISEDATLYWHAGSIFGNTTVFNHGKILLVDKGTDSNRYYKYLSGSTIINYGLLQVMPGADFVQLDGVIINEPSGTIALNSTGLWCFHCVNMNIARVENYGTFINLANCWVDTPFTNHPNATLYIMGTSSPFYGKFFIFFFSNTHRIKNTDFFFSRYENGMAWSCCFSYIERYKKCSKIRF